MPDLHVESVEELAGLISTIDPYAGKHPDRARPLAAAIVKTFAVGAGEPAEPEHPYRWGERVEVRFNDDWDEAIFLGTYVGGYIKAVRRHERVCDYHPSDVRPLPVDGSACWRRCFNGQWCGHGPRCTAEL